MATATTSPHCPECGAPAKIGDKHCWMCYRPLAWEGSAVKAAAVAVAFAQQPSQLPQLRYQTNVWAVVGIVLASLAMGPAAVAACLVTCVAVAGNSNPQAMEVAIYSSLGSGFVVIVGFGVLIAMLGAHSMRVIRY